MTVLMKELRILAVVNKDPEKVKKGLVKLSKNFKGTVYLLHLRNFDFYPAEVLLEFEKKFEELKERGLRMLNDIASEIEKVGFDVKVLGVQYGIAGERMRRIVNELNPDLVVLEKRCELLSDVELEEPIVVM